MKSLLLLLLFRRIRFVFVYSRKTYLDQRTASDIKYRCTAVCSESLNGYFISIFSLLKITYLDIDCAQIPLLTCLKLIGLLSDLQTLQLSSLSLPDAKRLSAEKWKTLHAVAYQNKITHVILDNITDFGEIQFLTLLCPLMEYLQISPINETILEHFIPFIHLKQTNQQLTALSTLAFDIRNGTDQMVDEFHRLLRWKFHLRDYSIQRIVNRFYFHWHVLTILT